MYQSSRHMSVSLSPARHIQANAMLGTQIFPTSQRCSHSGPLLDMSPSHILNSLADVRQIILDPCVIFADIGHSRFPVAWVHAPREAGSHCDREDLGSDSGSCQIDPFPRPL